VQKSQKSHDIKIHSSLKPLTPTYANAFNQQNNPFHSNGNGNGNPATSGLIFIKVENSKE
jgi:hypothetical protein